MRIYYGLFTFFVFHREIFTFGHMPRKKDNYIIYFWVWRNKFGEFLGKAERKEVIAKVKVGVKTCTLLIVVPFQNLYYYPILYKALLYPYLTTSLHGELPFGLCRTSFLFFCTFFFFRLRPILYI